jgi:hypothetical protein
MENSLSGKNPEVMRVAQTFLDIFDKRAAEYLTFLDKFDNLDERQFFCSLHPEIAKYAEGHTKPELIKILPIVAIAWAVAEVLSESHYIP